MKIDDEELLITPKQAAKKLGVTDLQVRNLIRTGLLASVTVGKRKLIPKDAPARFVAENTVKTCPDETPDPAYGSLRDVTRDARTAVSPD
jgi:excisionase family DNA binding protein